MTITIAWQILDESNTITSSGSVSGDSRLFVADNLQTARRNALPDALKNASEKLVSQIAHGF